MLISEENTLIYKLYESPDNILINGRYHQYNDISIGNFTGMMDESGNYVVSDDVRGHSALKRMVRSSQDPVKSVKTNLTKSSDVIRLLNNGAEIRIWPKFEVFSMWKLYDISSYKESITGAISRIGGHPESYLYDEYESTEYQSYDEIFSKESTEEDRYKQLDLVTQRGRNQKALGDYMARSKDVDDDTPSFYKQKKKAY
jgi:hypothetical protein